MVALVAAVYGITSGFAQEANMTVRVTSPVNKERVPECSDITLRAEASIQTGKIKIVYFYQAGKSLASDRSEPYEYVWKNVPRGFYEITARALDDANNEVFSDPVRLFVGDIEDGNVVKNGEFYCRAWPWSFSNYNGAVGQFSIDNNAWLSDSSAAYIEVDVPGEFDYNMQLFQDIPVDSGHTYTISFLADAERDRQIAIVFQLGHDPWTTYFYQTIDLAGFDLYGPYEFPSTVNDPEARFLFNVGQFTGDVFIDDVKIIDPLATGVESLPERGTISAISDYVLLQNYPNPFNPRTKISYILNKEARVRLSVLNLMGEEVARLVEEHQPSGQHSAWFDGDSHASGVYITRLMANGQVQTRKMLLLK
jgi:hypothetical protein